MRYYYLLITIFIFDLALGQQRPPSSALRRPPTPVIRPSNLPTGPAGSLRSLEYKVIKLSYIQTDRALATLKTMGYYVVEYKSSKGEISGENNFTPIFSNKPASLDAPGALPVIIKLPDTETISLVEKSTSKKSSKSTPLGVDLGGVVLNNTTSGEPLQRLMVGHKPGDTSSYAELLDLIQNKIDVPASQIAIEALVLEINSDKLDELGVDFSSAAPGFTADFPPPEGGSISPFTMVLDRTLLGSGANFRANIEALVSNKAANILSKPSVLVLDGRQARIQIGQQIPIVKVTDTQVSTSRGVDYVPVGIVLNLRPRISENGARVTIQVETIISDTEERIGATGGDVESAPIINNRKVQSFVRVANNTPFIIGGLISEKDSKNTGGVPLLSQIPFLKLFFSVRGAQDAKKEVIVVITPHVITEEEDNFSRVIPQDDKRFDQVDNLSFPNSYRVKREDVFDLSFINESPVFQNIIAEVDNRVLTDKTLLVKEPYKSLLEGKIPGEAVLVKKMLLDIINRTNYFEYIDPKKVIYFKESSDDPAGFEVEPLAPDIENIPDGKALKLTYSVRGKATLEKPFVRPSAKVNYIQMNESFKNELARLNKLGSSPAEDVFTILITKDELDKYERRLYEVLILKKLLDLNPDLELSLQYFRPGVEILFPSPGVLRQGPFVVDRQAARYFYEINSYYSAFDKEFNRQTAEIGRLLKNKK